MRSRPTKCATKLFGVLLKLPVWLCFPITNVIKFKKATNDTQRQFCLYHNFRSWHLATPSGKIMQFRAEPSLKFLGHDNNEGLQSEITGISDTAHPDVMRGIFNPSMAKKATS